MQTVFALPGSVTVKGRTFPVPKPTATDLARVREQMRLLARANCTEPLKYVAAQIEGGIPPAVIQIAIGEALKLGSGGGVEPTDAAVAREYDSLAGVRYRLWFHARKLTTELTHADVEALVGEEEQYDVADALFTALGLGERGADAPKAPSAGAS